MSGSATRTGNAFGGAVLVLVAVGAVSWAAILDDFAAGAWRHWLGWVLTLGPAMLLLVVTLTPLSAGRPWVRSIGCGAVAAALIVVLVPWSARKRFVSDLHSVRPGMTVDEADAVMDGYMKGMGAKWSVPAGQRPAVRDPGDSEDRDAELREQTGFDSHRSPESPGGGERLHLTGTRTYRWSDDGAYDSDFGQVEFKDGKVVRVEFLPD